MVAGLLDAGADGGYPLGVEAEPVHAADVPGVLHLDAAVHDHGQPGVRRDPRALDVDHPELAPQRLRPDRNRLGRDTGQRLRRAEHVHHIHRFRHIRQRRIADLVENRRLPGVHRNHPVPVPLEVVPDEVGRPQLVARQPHDRDRRRSVQHPLNVKRVLVCGQVSHSSPSTTANPCSRSQIRSETLSSPTDSRTVPGPTPVARSSSSPSCRCVVLAGWMTRLFASPTFARCDHSVIAPISPWPPARPPAQSNENTAPAPRGRYFITSGSYWLPGRAGYVTLDASGCDARKDATARAFDTCRSIRSDSVSSPCRNRNALNGDIAAPRSRSVSARSFIRYP